MLYIAHTKNYFISDFLRFKLKCFKPSTFLNLKLFFDINPRPYLLGYSYSLVHLFYSLKNRKLNTSFMEINLISDNKSPVIYYQIEHGTKLKNRRKNRVEIINYNINYNVKLGRDTPGERGSYVLKKTLLRKNSLPLKRKRVFFFKRI